MRNALSDSMNALYTSLGLAIEAFEDFFDALNDAQELYFERTEDFSRKLVRSLEPRYTPPIRSVRYYRRGAV